jgi:hypothetical protein
VTPTDFHAAWQAENPGMLANRARRYKQVVAHFVAYRPGWPLAALTCAGFQAYVAVLGLVDSTTVKHVKFFRECFCLAGRARWLMFQVRYGRSPVLQAEELHRLMALLLFEQDALGQECHLRQLPPPRHGNGPARGWPRAGDGFAPGQDRR